MAEIKTKQNDASVEAFLQTINEEEKRKDSAVVLKMRKRITKQEPKMCGSGIIGFGSFHYKSERSKQEGDGFMTGFSPRKKTLRLILSLVLPHILICWKNQVSTKRAVPVYMSRNFLK